MAGSRRRFFERAGACAALWAGRMFEMSRYIKIGLVTFLVTVIGSSLIAMLMGLIHGDALRDLMPNALIVGLHASWIPVVAVVALFMIFDVLGTKLDWLAMRETHRFKLRADVDTAHRVCLESLKQLNRGVEILKHDKQAGEIHARTAMTWRSFGEFLRFKLTEEDASVVDVQVLSRPLFALTNQDYGINARNIETVARTLGQYAPR